jgi:putative OPT family oligopeptide transporter
MLLQFFKDSAGIALFQEKLRILWHLPSSIVRHMTENRDALGSVTHKGAVAFSTPSISPALIGVGYIIGFKYSAVNFSGGVLAWLVFIPLILFVDPDLTGRLAATGVVPGELDVIQSVWSNIVRPVAVGAMLVGAAHTMWGMRTSIASAFRGAFHKGSRVASPSRLERDIDSRSIVLGIVALTIPMAWLYWKFTDNLVGAVVAAVVMLALGFLLSAVGGYLVGLVGGSNQPVSGLTLSALILAALLMVALGVTGLQGVGAVLGVAAVVCCAICVSGSLIQDLKVGHILGGTPRKMELAEIVATVTTSFVLVFPMLVLHEKDILEGGIGIGSPNLPAPQAGLMAQLAQGIVGGEMPWGLVLFGMFFAVSLILINAPSPTLIAVGMYLPFQTTGAIFLGGCLKALADWFAKRRRADGERFDNFGLLVASGLVAGESITGVLLAGLVFASKKYELGVESVSQLLFGVKEFAWVAGPWGACTSLLALGLIVWLLVGLPLRHVKPETV